VEGSCEHGNEPSGSIKCWEICELHGFSSSNFEMEALKIHHFGLP
jgi:hypothetical protein